MPETADRPESLFAAAAALPPDARGAYLERNARRPAIRDGFSRVPGPRSRGSRDRPARIR